MKMMKYLSLGIVSLLLVGCANSQAPRKITNVEYRNANQVRVTTLEDGSQIVENMQDVYRINDKKDRDRAQDEKELGF